MSARRTLRRVLSLFRRRRAEAELSEEIRSHLACAEEDALRRGLSREEARREARRLFGGIEPIKEAQRDSRGIPWLEAFLRDLRHGIAGLRRTPGFAATILAILSLGIGGTVAMFSLADAVLLRPLPFPDPDRIAGIWEAPRPGVNNATSVPEFLAWKQLGTRFEAMSAEQPVLAALNASDGPIRLPGKLVTSEYFKVFGTNTALGRTFAAEEDQPGAAPVVVLSHSAWETYFGGDRNILQHPILLDGLKYQVIGVLEPGAFDRDEVKFWRPLVFTREDRSSAIHRLTVYGRVRAGSNIAQARAQMKSIHAALLSNSLIDEDRAGTIEVKQLALMLTGDGLRRSIEIAFGAVLLVLLITCANVANLLFARGAARRPELAVRTALGAGRKRLVGQLVTESFALCAAGGAGGIAVAYALLRLAAPYLADALPFTAEVQINLHALIFAAAAVLAVTLLAGTLPALEALRGNLADALKQTSRLSSAVHIRLRRGIVIAEVALSLVLVAGALLLARSLRKLEQVDTRMRIENVTTASVHLPEQAYPSAEKAAVFYDALEEQLRATPGLKQFGLTNYLPLQWISNGEGIFVPGIEKPLFVRCKRADAGYFRTLEIPVLAGRGIGERDGQRAPRVVVINQALAARLADVAHMKDVVGKTVKLTSSDYSGAQAVFTDVQIVGIIRNERTTAPGLAEPPVVYVPLAQSPVRYFRLLVRSSAETGTVVSALRHALRAVDPNLPLADVATLEQIRRETLSGVSRPAWLIGVFALVAIVLSAVGLYGVMAYAVTQRRVEFAIRMALGAHSGDVLGHVLKSALAMVAMGLGAGMIGVFAMTRLLKSLLFEISPLDPFALGAACALTVAIGLMAGLIPARRAARIDPAVDLRNGG
ncbi:MAG TPA: ABC transporter permease [Bryobacteraceae bacterium]|jgi:putative ABC transport system permease protein|nr:ABC transporter permease [Bryobacteraceae bacterium]